MIQIEKSAHEPCPARCSGLLDHHTSSDRVLQIALAEYYFAEGNYADSEQLLERLAGNAASSAQALSAKIKLAEMHLSRRKVEAAEALVTDVLKKDAP